MRTAQIKLLLCLIVPTICMEGRAQQISAVEWYGNAESMGMGDCPGVALDDGCCLHSSDSRFGIFDCYIPQSEKTWAVNRVSAHLRLPYMRTEMMMFTCRVDAQSSWADLSFQLGQSGDRTAMERMFSLRAARAPTSHIHYGAGGGIYHVGYGRDISISTWFAEAFLFYWPAKDCRIGLYVFNLTGNRMEDFNLTVNVCLSAAWYLAKDLNVALSLDKQQGQPLFARAGIKKTVLNGKLSYLFGLRYPYLQPTAGLGLCLKKYQVDTAVIFHQNGNCSCALSLSRFF